MLIAKLWPGKRGGPTFWHPVEHLVRVFETVAKLKIRSVMRAMVPKLFARKLPQQYFDRLSRCGVEITDDFISADDLWTAMSTSRLVFCDRVGICAYRGA
ncbi:MAG: hypothetical protein H0V34_04360 [Gammaproteobacteria bacterium]|nr:hypothetical protein [Gammaproteobacteria bacterium]